MVFWGVVELVVGFIILLVFVTQIFTPLLSGTKWFPAIRRRSLDVQLKEVKEELEKENELEEIESELEKLKKKREEKEKDERVGQQQSSETGPREN